MNLNSFKVTTKNVVYNKIFLISDIHFGVRTNSIEWIENIKTFFYDFYIPLIKDKKQDNDIICILGDFFDNRQLLDIAVMNAGLDIICELASIMPVYFIVGNHDIYKKKDTDVNSLSIFKHIPNVYIEEKPVIITDNNSRILLLPWIGDSKEEENYIRANKFDYVFAHADIVGFRYDNGREIKNTGANFKDKNIKRLFSGHIHKRQQMENLIYIGSPYHTKRSDIGNDKGIYIFDPTENTYDFVFNTVSPIFQRITLEDILNYKLSEVSELLENNYTDIIVPDKFIHLFNLTKFVDLLENCNYKKIETGSDRKRFDDDVALSEEEAHITDILTLLERSIDDLQYTTDTIDKLKKMNKTYYEKAKKDDIDVF